MSIRALTAPVAIVRCDTEGCSHRRVYDVDDGRTLEEQLREDGWLTLEDMRHCCIRCVAVRWEPAHPPTGARGMPGVG